MATATSKATRGKPARPTGDASQINSSTELIKQATLDLRAIRSEARASAQRMATEVIEPLIRIALDPELDVEQRRTKIYAHLDDFLAKPEQVAR